MTQYYTLNKNILLIFVVFVLYNFIFILFLLSEIDSQQQNYKNDKILFFTSKKFF